MKKNYFAPEVIIVNMHPCSLLEVSANVDGNSALQYKGNSGNASSGLSRSSSFDDED
jgi:hypothetical protein